MDEFKIAVVLKSVILVLFYDDFACYLVSSALVLQFPELKFIKEKKRLGFPE